MIPYLPLPKFDFAQEIIKGDIMYTSIRPGFNAYQVKDRKILSEIKRVFEPLLSAPGRRTHVWVQNIDNRFNNYIHYDPRDYAISCILSAGGENVVTSMHNLDKSVKYSTVLETNKWHIIKTSELHSVNNIESLRVAITISVGIGINNHLLDLCKFFTED